tara:strand:- start:29 stop:250 length:222 start_codon:yes stop_codon:yes gene_type:complete
MEIEESKYKIIRDVLNKLQYPTEQELKDVLRFVEAQAKEIEQLKEENQDLEEEGCKMDDLIRESTKLREQLKK